MKKSIILFLLLFLNIACFAEKDKYNIEDGYVAEGYDVVSYFQNEPKKGKNAFTYIYDKVKFKFNNQDNLDLFKADPLKYMPQYGAWCAYAVGATNSKVQINPKTYEIRKGKLYLFYNSYFNNTYDKWIEIGPNVLIEKADKNWKTLRDKK